MNIICEGCGVVQEITDPVDVERLKKLLRVNPKVELLCPDCFGKEWWGTWEQPTK